MNIQKLRKINKYLCITVLILLVIESVLVAIMLIWNKSALLPASWILLTLIICGTLYLISSSNLNSKMLKPNDMTHEERIRSIHEAIRVVSYGSNRLAFKIDEGQLDKVGKFETRLRNPYLHDALVDLSDKSREIMLGYLNEELEKEEKDCVTILEDYDENVGDVLIIKDL